MQANIVLGKVWQLFLDGRYQLGNIKFLPNGKLDGRGIEGFHQWDIEEDLLILSGELGKVSYSLKYNESAHMLHSIGQHRNSNNNIILLEQISRETIDKLFPNNSIAKNIVNKSAYYRSPTGEIWGHLIFGIDGKIYNYHNDNETYWGVAKDKFYIYNSKKEVTLTSKYFTLQKDAKNILSIALTYEHDSSSTHYLDFLQVEQQDEQVPAKFLHMDIVLSNRASTLIVTLNSAAREYNGRSSSFEFYNLPLIFASDYIRISPSAPTRWYLEDWERIKAVVNLNQYQKVIFAGMSAGGYFAIWAAEMLARDNPSTNYFSIAIQPLFSITRDALQHHKTLASDEWRSKTPTYDFVEDYQDKTLSLQDFLKENLDNVEHYVIYDTGNEVEEYSASQLKSLRTNLMPMVFNLDHSGGCGAIYNTGITESIIRKLVKEKLK